VQQPPAGAAVHEADHAARAERAARVAVGAVCRRRRGGGADCRGQRAPGHMQCQPPQCPHTSSQVLSCVFRTQLKLRVQVVVKRHQKWCITLPGKATSKRVHLLCKTSVICDIKRLMRVDTPYLQSHMYSLPPMLKLHTGNSSCREQPSTSHRIHACWLCENLVNFSRVFRAFVA
jgi:hypothetical protein